MFWYFRYIRVGERPAERWVVGAENINEANEKMRQDPEKWERSSIKLYGPYNTEEEANFAQD